MAIHTIIGSMEAMNERTKSEHNASQSKLWRDNYAILMPDANPSKDHKSRLRFLHRLAI